MSLIVSSVGAIRPALAQVDASVRAAAELKDDAAVAAAKVLPVLQASWEAAQHACLLASSVVRGKMAGALLLSLAAKAGSCASDALIVLVPNATTKVTNAVDFDAQYLDAYAKTQLLLCWNLICISVLCGLVALRTLS